ncbi:MAG TPA: phosphate ABC transporter permease subunit PstC [Geobacterales bacterium]|nr:phosphate ABC transporter permease subunit PstC [Geobacterales bacterium]
MRGDKIFLYILLFISALFVVIVFLLGFELYRGSSSIFDIFGFNFILSSTWDPVRGVFGIAPVILGSFLTCFIALILAIPVALLTSYFISELVPSRLKIYITSLVELLAAVPSVVYGLWGILVLVPFLRDNIYVPLQSAFYFLPGFGGAITGYGILTAGILLAIMILPTITSITKEAIELLPASIKEAAIALGAMRYQSARIIFTHIKLTIIAAIMLGFARAFGEAMAVAMVIGGSHLFPNSIFATGYTLPSLIVNEFTEATSPLHYSALIAAGFVLFVIALANIVVARLIIYRTTRFMRLAI